MRRRKHIKPVKLFLNKLHDTQTMAKLYGGIGWVNLEDYSYTWSVSKKFSLRYLKYEK
jgi:hypothetical protein